jgi:hypothetical protein
MQRLLNGLSKTSGDRSIDRVAVRLSLSMICRLAVWIGCFLFSIAIGKAHALPPDVQSYLETHCNKCHDGDVQKGEFRIDNLSPKVGFENTPQWLEIMERIGSVLTLSPSNIEKYLAAAETILNEAYPELPAKNAKPKPPFGGANPVLYEEQISADTQSKIKALLPQVDLKFQ